VKSRILLSVIVCLVSVALLLPSCGTKIPQTTTATTQPKAGTPKYGGSIAVAAITTTENWDPAGTGSQLEWIAQHNIYQSLTYADWTKGPAGSGEVAFTESMLGAYFVPLLAESWTMESPTKYVFKLRQGMRFQNKAPANGREVTADDWVYSFKRTGENNGFASYAFPPEKVYAQDKYTLVFEFAEPKFEAVKRVSYQYFVFPPEVVAADGTVDWKNTCGTGPYILSDYEASSSATLTKNPNYWQADPLRQGNKLPYIDKITLYYISDNATRIAGLRTGKIDRLGELSFDEAKDLAKTNPELLQSPGPGDLHSLLELT
jgi:peptide/nickel transport system substrate-binding protein